MDAPANRDRPADPAGDALNRRLQVPGRRLFVGGERSVRKTLVVRATLVLVLFALVMTVFWFDRDGLQDNHDGSISFTDVVYFTMVSVTTVGYGDIVPVTRQARLVDALLVTPIRLFIWLIFVGTAYQLVLQRLIEDFRMRRLLLRQSGATSTVLPSRVGGILMADSIESSHLATYVMDLISAGGQVTLMEREPRPDEIGRRPFESRALILRVVRDRHSYSFWENDLRIQPEDKLIVIGAHGSPPDER